MMDRAEISVSPRKLTWMLAAVAIALACASVACAVAKYRFGHGELQGASRLFDLMQEANVPTWFSSVLLLVCATWLWMIGRLKKAQGEPFARHWAGLAIVFVMLSLDETAQVHDLVSDQLQARLHTSGVFFYAWVIPAIGFLAVLAVTYFRFLLHLPNRTRILFLLAGTVYVGGAVGMEMVAAIYDQSHDFENAVTAAMANVEETMEMAGLVIFIYALTAYLSSTFGRVGIGFGFGAPATQERRTDAPAVLARARSLR